VTPAGYRPCRDLAGKLAGVVVRDPIVQEVSGRHGLFQVLNLEARTLPLPAFRALAESPRYAPPAGLDDDPDALERRFWKALPALPAMYGADVPGSLFDPDVALWNINRLGTILDIVSEDASVQIAGVNTAYLYVGMWKAAFCWHTEDVELYSINYIHTGAPKTWYCIPPAHAARFERLAREFFVGDASQCAQFLRHKMNLVSPAVLREYSIPCHTVRGGILKPFLIN
jgi:jumonji domain-containing protein 2